LAAVALFAMGVHFAPFEASIAHDRGSLSAAFDGAHRSVAASAEQTSVGEFGLAERDCPPVCPIGCPHSPSADCCGSGILAVSSVVVAVILAAGNLPREADRGLSGVEPDALQEPPQLFA
jgi:hypothetical protein